MPKIGRVALAAVAVAVLAGAAFTAVPPSSAAPLRETLCGHNEHLPVHAMGGGLTYQVRNPYWRGTGKACIETTRGAGFTVLRTPRPGDNVVAFPDIFRGCIWGICTPDHSFPIRASHVHKLYGSWYTREGASGTWNASFEMWFGKQRLVNDHANGAELMVWLNHHGACCALARGYKRLRIDGRTWLLTHWRATDHSVRTRHSGMKWNYIQFRLVHPRWKINHLDLKKFITISIRRGLIRRSWWMENVGAGFEIWRGGVGLATTRFRVHTS